MAVLVGAATSLAITFEQLVVPSAPLLGRLCAGMVVALGVTGGLHLPPIRVTRMADKRSWRVIRYHLLRAAEHTLISTGGEHAPLADVVWIREPYDPRHKDEIETRRREAWARLHSPAAGTSTAAGRFGIAVCEWGGVKPAKYGQAITVRQVGWPPFMISAVGYQALLDRFPQIALHDQAEAGQLMMAATFALSKGGYPVIIEAGFLAVDEHWLPYENTDAAIASALVASSG